VRRQYMVSLKHNFNDIYSFWKSYSIIAEPVCLEVSVEPFSYTVNTFEIRHLHKFEVCY